jgi:hypothetical protein
MTHHNLGRSRAMPSHLGGFTSKSNKCHKDCFIMNKWSSAHKEDSFSTQTWISHKSHKLHQEVLGRAHKGIRVEIFLLVASAPSKGGGRGDPFIAGYGKLPVGVPDGRTSSAQGRTSLESIQISTIGMRPRLVWLTGRTCTAGLETFC